MQDTFPLQTVEAPKGGAPKGEGGGPEGSGPRRVEAPKGGAPKRFHMTAPRAQTCTFQGPGLQKHTQNSTKGPPREGGENENNGRRGKKRAKI